MSREHYQARSKKVTKLGRDGLVEQDRATGQEQRVSQRTADISFGPERPREQQPQAERNDRQHTAQKKQQIQSWRREHEEINVVPPYEPEGIDTGSTYSTTPYESAPSMRTAEDIPALRPPTVHGEPRPTERKHGKKHRKQRSEPERRLSFEQNRDQTTQPEAARVQALEAPQMETDAERRTEGAEAPSEPAPFRASEDAPLRHIPPIQGRPRQARRRMEDGGRLEFESSRVTPKQTKRNSASRSSNKTKQARRFATEADAARQEDLRENGGSGKIDRPFSYENTTGNAAATTPRENENSRGNRPGDAVSPERPVKLHDEGMRLRFDAAPRQEASAYAARPPVKRRQAIESGSALPDMSRSESAPPPETPRHSDGGDTSPDAVAVPPAPEPPPGEASPLPPEEHRVPVQRSPPVADGSSRDAFHTDQRERLKFEPENNIAPSPPDFRGKQKKRAVIEENRREQFTGALQADHAHLRFEDAPATGLETGTSRDPLHVDTPTVLKDDHRPPHSKKLLFEDARTEDLTAKGEQRQTAREPVTAENPSRSDQDTGPPYEAAGQKDDESTDAPRRTDDPPLAEAERPFVIRPQSRLHFETASGKGDSEKAPRRVDGDSVKSAESSVDANRPRLRFEETLPVQSEGKREQKPPDTGENKTKAEIPKISKLRFEDAPRAASSASGPPATKPDTEHKPPSRQQRQYEKAERRVEQASRKLEKAQSRLPTERRAHLERQYDEKSGKVRRRLRFEEQVIPEGAKPPLPVRATGAAAQTIKTAAVMKLHQKVRQSEHENVAIEAAHKTEFVVERQAGRALRWSKNRLKSRPYRAARQAEQKLTREQTRLAWQTARRDNPQLASNPYSRWRQKQAIKRQYAAAKRAGVQPSQAVKQGAKKVEQAAKKTADFVRKHQKGFLIVGALVLIVAMFSSLMTSCSTLLQGGISAVGVSTYPSEDSEMLAAEARYCEMEAALQAYLDTYESTHDYDSYTYDLDDIEHDPYVLISMLTALHGGAWTLADVLPTLQTIFNRQYTLTETVTTSGEGEEATTSVTVKLENADLSHLPVYMMTQDKLSMYAMYIGNLGNRADLFPSSAYINRYVIQNYTDYEIPTEALEDETFAAMIEEAEKYLGYPYVWGGASPSTSFDCSGFVSWVINQSGWNVGRLTAQGLHDICTPTSTPHPGDLVFYTGTYDAGVPVTHVGLYVGDGWMIHTGDPISYCHFSENSYYMGHLYGYGHLP